MGCSGTTGAEGAVMGIYQKESARLIDDSNGKIEFTQEDDDRNPLKTERYIYQKIPEEIIEEKEKQEELTGDSNNKT